MNSEKITNEFNRIKNLGFVKSNRSNNTGIGKTFEDYLGVDENNHKGADFDGFEVKSQRDISSSYVTLFTKSPSSPKKANAYLKDNFGKPDSHYPELKALHTSSFGDKWNTYINKYGMKMAVNEEEERIYLLVKSIENDTILSSMVYWTFDDIKESLKKLSWLFIVTAKTKKEDNIEYFHYTNAIIYYNISFRKFIEELKSGAIMFDIRIGVYKSGKNTGKPHDHGSGFRIKRENLNKLYENILVLE